MSHFSSKRLLQAQRVKLNNVKNKPALVSSTGRGRVNFRLINRRVYKEKPKAKPPLVVSGRIQNNNQIVDPDDMFGGNGTTWIKSIGIKVGDTVSFISTQTNQLFTTTVDTISTNAQGDAYMLILKDNHGQNVGVNVDVTLHIS